MKRRPTPTLIIAVLALIVAMSGTAVAAGVLVKTSDQLADGVVTNPKLARDSVDSRTVLENSLNRNDIGDRAVTNRELSNPIFTAAVEPDGHVSSGQSVGVDPALTKRIDQVGGGVVYDVGFDADISSCVYTATPGETRRGGTLAPVILDVQQRPGQPHVVQIFVRDADGSFFTPLRPSFHLIVAC